MLSHGGSGAGEGGPRFADHADKPFTVVGIPRLSATPLDRAVLVSLEGLGGDPCRWHMARPSPASDRARARTQFDLRPAGHRRAGRLHSRTAVFRVQRQINTHAGEPLTAILPGATLQQLWDLQSVSPSRAAAVLALVVAAGLAGMVSGGAGEPGERRRELAILRVSGASPREVFALLCGRARCSPSPTALGPGCCGWCMPRLRPGSSRSMVVVEPGLARVVANGACSARCSPPAWSPACCRGCAPIASRSPNGMTVRTWMMKPFRARLAPPRCCPVRAAGVGTAAGVRAQAPLAGPPASMRWAIASAAPGCGQRASSARSAGTTSSLPTGTPRVSPASSSTSSRTNDRGGPRRCSACARSGTARPGRARMAGARVRIPGFVVPLETSGEKIREFLPCPISALRTSRRRPPTSSSTSSPTNCAGRLEHAAGG